MGRQRQPYFLPYQQRWLADSSRLKIAEKSRRIGWTYVQAYEDVVDAARAPGMDVWFSSADITAAKEYIRYVEQWARLLDAAAKTLGEVVISDDEDIKALVVEFANGRRIHALSSNPKAFRSKGGKVVLDEFAFHAHADELWKAASPSILWGYPMRVFSSHNGKGSRFYRMCQDAAHSGNWSLHRVTLMDAIADGLVERISRLGRSATASEIESFVAECRAIAGDEETFQQEFMCNPQDEAAAYIPWALIFANEDSQLQPPIVLNAELNVLGEVDMPTVVHEHWSPAHNRYVLGMDVGRSRDLSVMWVDELVDGLHHTRLVLELHGVRFALQRGVLYELLQHCRAARIDATGIGAQLAEEATERWGQRVLGVTMTNQAKGELAVKTRAAFEDARLRNPGHDSVRNDFAKVKRTITPGGFVAFGGERGPDGHADRFWARALAIAAASAAPWEADYRAVEPRAAKEGVFS